MRRLQAALAALLLPTPAAAADVYLVRPVACPSDLAGPGEFPPVAESGGRFYAHRVAPALVVRYAAPTRQRAEDARTTALLLTAKAKGL